MQFISRFPIIVWFLIIALITSLSISYFAYEHVFHRQIQQAQGAELKRIRSQE